MADLRFKLDIDFTPFNDLLKRAADTESRLNTTFQKISKSLSGHLGTALTPATFEKSISVIGEVEKRLQSLVNFSTKVQIPQTGITQSLTYTLNHIKEVEKGMLSMLRTSQTVSTQVTAAIEKSYKNVARKVSELASQIEKEQARYEKTLSAAATVGPATTRRGAKQLEQLASLKQEREALETTLRDMGRLYHQLDTFVAQTQQLEAKIQSSNLYKVLEEKLFKHVRVLSGGTQPLLPRFTSERDIVAWLPKWQEQLNKMQDVFLRDVERFEAQIAERIPQISEKGLQVFIETTKGSKGYQQAARELVQRKKDLETLRNELRSVLEKGILPVFESPQTLSLLQKAAIGSPAFQSEIDATVKRLSNVAAKVKELKTKFASITESIPAEPAATLEVSQLESKPIGAITRSLRAKQRALEREKEAMFTLSQEFIRHSEALSRLTKARERITKTLIPAEEEKIRAPLHFATTELQRLKREIAEVPAKAGAIDLRPLRVQELTTYISQLRKGVDELHGMVAEITTLASKEEQAISSLEKPYARQVALVGKLGQTVAQLSEARQKALQLKEAKKEGITILPPIEEPPTAAFSDRIKKTFTSFEQVFGAEGAQFRDYLETEFGTEIFDAIFAGRRVPSEQFLHTLMETASALDVVGAAQKRTYQGWSTIGEGIDVLHDRIEKFIHLWRGAAQPGQVPSAQEILAQVSTIKRGEKITAGPEFYEFTKDLQTQIDNATGYVKRELANAVAQAHLDMKRFGESAKFVQPVVDTFKFATERVNQFFDAFKQGAFFTRFESLVGKTPEYLSAFGAEPIKNAPALESHLDKLAAVTSAMGEGFTKVNREAAQFAAVFRLRPFMQQLEDVLKKEITVSSLSETQSALEQIDQQLLKMTAYGKKEDVAGLEKLRNEFRKVKSEFEKGLRLDFRVDTTQLKQAFTVLKKFGVGVEEAQAEARKIRRRLTPKSTPEKIEKVEAQLLAIGERPGVTATTPAPIIEEYKTAVRAAFTREFNVERATEALAKLHTSLMPMWKFFNVAQALSELASRMTQYSRAAGDAGRNVQFMLNKSHELVRLAAEGVEFGLPATESIRFEKHRAEYDKYVARIYGAHIPAIESLKKAYQDWGDYMTSLIGKSVQPPTGTLPDLIRRLFTPPSAEDVAMSFDAWMTTMSRKIGRRAFIPEGPEFAREYTEILLPPKPEKQLTVAEMFGTGRFELIERAANYTKNFAAAMNFALKSLKDAPEATHRFFQPALGSVQKLAELMEKLRVAIVAAGDAAHPKTAGINLALQQAKLNAEVTAQSFEIFRKSVKSGMAETDVGQAELAARLDLLMDSAKKTLRGHFREFGRTIRTALLSEDPQVVYSAFKEMMKLPVDISKEGFLSKGVGQILFGSEVGGTQSWIAKLSGSKIQQIQQASIQYLKEVEQSGFGEKYVSFVRAATNRLNEKLSQVLEARVREARGIVAQGEFSSLAWGKPLAAPSYLAQPEGEILSAGGMKGAFRSMLEVRDIETGMGEFFQRWSKRVESWSASKIQSVLDLVKRKIRTHSETIARSAVPAAGGVIDLQASIAEITPAIAALDKLSRYEEILERAYSRRVEAESRQRLKVAAAPGRAKEPAKVVPGKEEALVSAEEEVAGIESTIATTKPAVAKTFDELTAVKLQKLLEQKEKVVEGVRGVATALSSGESEIGQKAGAITSKLMGSVGGGEFGEGPQRATRTIVDAFVELNNNLQVFGHSAKRAGEPLAIYPQFLAAAKQNIDQILNSLKHVGYTTEDLDQKVAKFNEEAIKTGGQPVRSFAELWSEIQGMMLNIEATFAEIKSGALSAEELATAQSGLVNIFGALRGVVSDYHRTINAVATDELLLADIHSRELAALEQLGAKWREADLAMRKGLGPAISGGRETVRETLASAREIAIQSLVGAAWRTTGAAEGGMFARVKQPIATAQDILVKLFGGDITQGLALLREQLAVFRSRINEQEIPALIETFSRINELFNLGIRAPKTGASLEEQYTFLKGVFEKLDSETRKVALLDWDVKWVQQSQRARDSIHGISDELSRLIEKATSPEMLGRRGIFAERTARVAFYEEMRNALERARKIYAATTRDAEANAAEVRKLSGLMRESETVTSNVLSLWERMTNAVRTAKDNFADLFLYQVRWYTSMMLFWGIFNKVTETFNNLVEAQHQIERAVRTMREQSGEIVTNYERLEGLARHAIFEGMVRFGVDAKFAAESLYQLGSAGLSAQEALAALQPVMALIRATEGDVGETTKIVAGLYNVLKDSIEPNIEMATKFRIISDVMSQVFKDHQVEINELNQSYRYSIAAADSLGLNFYELSALIGIMNDNMVKGSRAGRGFAKVLQHMAKQPLEVAQSFVLLAEHMGIPLKVYEKLAGPEVRKMTAMDMLREMSKIVKASGKSFEELGRIFEDFGMVGGRALAPLLLNMDKIDSEITRLRMASVGAGEEQASRMTQTVASNIRRIASFIQSALFPVFTVVHTVMVSTVRLVRTMADMMDGVIEKFSKIAEKGTTIITGVLRGAPLTEIRGEVREREVFPGFVQTFINASLHAFTLLGILKLVSGQLGSWDIFSKVVTKVTAQLGSIGSLLSGIAGAFGKIGKLLAVFSVGGLVAGLKALFAAVIGGFASLGQALYAFWLTPAGKFMIIASVIVGAFVAIKNAWGETLDSIVEKSESATAKFTEQLGKIEQRAVSAYHATAEIVAAQEAVEAAIAKGAPREVATEEQREAMVKWLATMGVADKAVENHAVTVGTLREKYATFLTLSRNMVSMYAGIGKAAAHNKELEELYGNALVAARTRTMSSMENLTKAYQKAYWMVKGKSIWDLFDLGDTRAVQFGPDWGRKLFEQIDPRTLSAEGKRKYLEATKLITEAIKDVGAAQANEVNVYFGRLSSLIANPMRAQVEAWQKQDWGDVKIFKALQDKLREELAAPNLYGMKWGEIGAKIFDSKEFLIQLQGNRDLLLQLVPAEVADWFRTLNLADNEQVKRAREGLAKGLFEMRIPGMAESVLASMGIKVDKTLTDKKVREIADAAMEALKTETEYRKSYIENLAKETELSYKIAPPTAEQFRLDTQRQYLLKREQLRQEEINLQREYYHQLSKLTTMHADDATRKLKEEQARNELRVKLIKNHYEQLNLAIQQGEEQAKLFRMSHTADLLDIESQRLSAQTKTTEASSVIEEERAKLARGELADVDRVRAAYERKKAAVREEIKLAEERAKLEQEEIRIKWQVLEQEIQEGIRPTAELRNREAELRKRSAELANEVASKKNQLMQIDREMENAITEFMGKNLEIRTHLLRQGAADAVQSQGDFFNRYQSMLHTMSSVTRTQLKAMIDETVRQASTYGETFTALMLAMEQVESGFNPRRVGTSGERGPFQFMPSTAAMYGVKAEQLEGFENRALATKIAIRHTLDLMRALGIDLSQLEGINEETWQKLMKVVAAYNAGLDRVKLGKIPASTLKHLEKVKKAFLQFRTGVKIPRDLRIRIPAEHEVVPSIVWEGFDAWYAKIVEMIGRGRPGAEYVKKAITDFYGLIRDNRLQPAEIKQFEDSISRLFDVWLRVKLPRADFFKMLTEPLKALLETGAIIDKQVVDLYVSILLKQKVSYAKIRKEMLEIGKTMFEDERNWTVQNFEDMLKMLDYLATKPGVSMTKFYNYLFSDVLSPTRLKTQIETNFELFELFYEKLMALGTKWLQGGIPYKIAKTFEQAIKEALTSGFELRPEQFDSLIRMMAKIPGLTMKEAFDNIAKFYEMQAQRHETTKRQLSELQEHMAMFGATAADIWKAIGSIADIEITKIYANWSRAAAGMIKDQETIKTLGDAFWWGMVKGLSDFASKLEDPIHRLGEMLTGTLESMRGTLEDVFTDFALHRLKDPQEYINKLAEGLARMAARNLSELAMEQVTGGIASLLGIPPEMISKEYAEKQAKLEDKQYKLESLAYQRATAENTAGILSAMGGGPAIPGVSGLEGGLGVEGEGGIAGVAESLEELETGGGGVRSPSIGRSTFGGMPSRTFGGAPGGIPSETPGGLFGGLFSGGFFSGIFNFIKGIISFIPSLLGLFGGMSRPTYGGASLGFSPFGFSPMGMQTGGFVKGSGGTDSVPVWLTPGEYVLSLPVVKKLQEGGLALGDLFEGTLELPIEDLFGGFFEEFSEGLEEQLEPLYELFKPHAGIGQGYYGPGFQQYASWSDWFNQTVAAEAQRKHQEWLQKELANAQEVAQGYAQRAALAGQFWKGLFSFPFQVFFQKGGLIGEALTSRGFPAWPGQVTTAEPIVKKTKTTWPWWMLALTYMSMFSSLLSMFKQMQRPKPTMATGKVGPAASTLYPNIDLLQRNGSFWDEIFTEPFDAETILGKGTLGLPEMGLSELGLPKLELGLPKESFSLWDKIKGFFGFGPLAGGAGSYGGMGMASGAGAAMGAGGGGGFFSSIGNFFSSIFSGIGSFFSGIFSFFRGMQHGGLVENILDWFGPTEAWAIEPLNILPELEKTWNLELAEASPEVRSYIEEAKTGIRRAAEFFQENNPAATTYIAEALGRTDRFKDPREYLKSSISPGSYYIPESDQIVMQLQGSKFPAREFIAEREPAGIQSQFANVLIHETIHSLQESGRPLAGFLPVIDSAKVKAYLEKTFPQSPAEYIEYLASPEEVMARGVAHYLTKRIYPEFKDIFAGGTWPEEYDALMRELADAVATGKYPAAPKLGPIQWLIWQWKKPFQIGGPVPGTGRGDIVPAMLEPGEFVVNRPTVSFFGPDFFYALQDLVKFQGAAPEKVLSGVAPVKMQMKTGGTVPKVTIPTPAVSPELKMTVVNVLDEESIEQFLGSKKYGDVFVNKLGARFNRRVLGSRGV